MAHISLTSDNILNRSQLTRFEISEYKKNLVSATLRLNNQEVAKNSSGVLLKVLKVAHKNILMT